MPATDPSRAPNRTDWRSAANPQDHTLPVRRSPCHRAPRVLLSRRFGRRAPVGSWAAEGQQTPKSSLRDRAQNSAYGPQPRMNRAITRQSSPIVVSVEQACHAGGRGFESRRSRRQLCGLSAFSARCHAPLVPQNVTADDVRYLRLGRVQVECGTQRRVDLFNAPRRRPRLDADLCRRTRPAIQFVNRCRTE
jgi:hypothetical protein